MIKCEFQLAVIKYIFLPVTKEFWQTVLDQQGTAEDSHNFKDGSVKFEVVFDDGNEAVGDDSDMHLNTHGIFGISPKALDAEMLLDPFEKQFHLPAVAVKQRNVFCGKVEVVGIIDERATEVSGIVNNPSDFRRVVFSIVLACETDNLVEKHIVLTLKEFLSKQYFVCRPSFLPYDEESPEQVNGEKSGEVKVAPIKHIAGQRLVCDAVHKFRVMHIGIGNSVEDRDFCRDINLCMHLDPRLCATEVSPNEERHAEVDGSGVNSVEPSVQLELLRDAPFLCERHHIKCELLEDARVAEHIRLGDCVPAGRRFSESKMVRPFSMCGNYIRKFPETAATYQLPEHKHKQLVPMGERPSQRPVHIFLDDSSELALGKKTHNLCENVFPCMHICTDLDSVAKMQNSNHGQYNFYLKHCA